MLQASSLINALRDFPHPLDALRYHSSYADLMLINVYSTCDLFLLRLEKWVPVVLCWKSLPL